MSRICRALGIWTFIFMRFRVSLKCELALLISCVMSHRRRSFRFHGACAFSGSGVVNLPGLGFVDLFYFLFLVSYHIEEDVVDSMTLCGISRFGCQGICSARFSSSFVL